MTSLFFERALLPGGWAGDVRIELDERGRVASVEAAADSEGAERFAGRVAVPGMANLHSHAFQFVIRGHTEARHPGRDDFWGWRERMYAALRRLGPADVEAIARALSLRLLKGGYTSVGEFHYLHHGPDGAPYPDAAELSLRVAAGVESTGLAITLLPTFYAHGGFGPRPPTRGQRRFVHAPSEFLELIDRLREAGADRPERTLGVAFHSLRAVAPGELHALLPEIEARLPGAPRHVHIAEQSQEVEDCLRWSGRRPVEWWMEEVPVDESWCLVHATHLSEAEMESLLASGAVAGLCPTTEANLGDGLFPAAEFWARGGRFGVGSDSHVETDAAAELRLLEYGQRLLLRARGVAAQEGRSTGRRLWEDAAKGGAAALGRGRGTIEVGQPADLVLLDRRSAEAEGLEDDALLDGLVFAPGSVEICDVWVGGRHVVQGGRHPDEAEVEEGLRRVRRRLDDAS